MELPWVPSFLVPRFSFLVLIFFALFFGTAKLSAQGKFPYGVVTANHPDSSIFLMNNNITQIKDLGVNFIVHRINTTNLPTIRDSGLKVIANNWHSEEDFIFNFSTALRTIYKPRPQNFSSYTEELRFSKGIQVNIEGTSYWKIETSESPGQAVHSGPNVAQYDRFINRYYSDDHIVYDLVWRMKISGDTTSTTAKVCSLAVVHIAGTDTFKIADTLLYAKDFSNQFKDIVLQYKLDELAQIYPLVKSNPEGPEYHPTPEDVNYIDAVTFKDGINYQLYYFGNRDLFIQSIECFDDRIWNEYMITSPQNFAIDLTNQTTNLEPDTSIISWLAYDEPHSIDLYSPLKVLYDSLQAKNINPPINSLYPEWDGIRNGNPTIKQFIDSVQPPNFMFYYLPFWYNTVPEEYHSNGITTLWHLNNRLKEAHNNFPGFWHIVQSMSYINAARTAYYWRKPAYEELTAQMHLALANGTKGLLLSNYYTYPRLEYYDETDPNQHIPLPVSEGLVYNLEGTGETWVTTSLYDNLKNYFKPRIQGVYGDYLQKLIYTGQFLSKAKRAITPSVYFADSSYESGKRLSMIAFNNTPEAHHYHHLGFFNDTEDAINHRYFLLVNAFPKVSNAADDVIHLSFTPPDTTLFKNFRFRNIEGGTDTNFSGRFTGSIAIHGGDGKLFQVAPTIRFGGKLTSNDEVKETEFLKENLRVLASDTLTVTGNYYLQANLQIDSGAGLGQTGYTYIDSTGSFNVSKWSNSLLKSRTGVYPRLLWADFPGTDSVLSYKIYRKKQDTVFSLLATVSSTARSFIDSGTSIIEGVPIMNETFSDYYVTVTVLLPGGRYQTASYNSNTIEYNRVRGTALQKNGLKKESQNSYSLKQNYPNPFNPETVISFSIKQRGFTTLRIFDISGKMIAELVNSVLEPGEYSHTFRPENHLSSGVYFIELVSGSFRAVQKTMYLK